MQDQLDGKSDMVRNVEEELQNTIAILREQVEVLESQLHDVKEENDILKYRMEDIDDKLEQRINEDDNEGEDNIINPAKKDADSR